MRSTRIRNEVAEARRDLTSAVQYLQGAQTHFAEATRACPATPMTDELEKVQEIIYRIEALAASLRSKLE
jgi:hypothetical protein